MSYPISNATKVNLDSATDDPSQARAELAALVDKFNQLLGCLSQTPGANQVPVLNSGGDYKLGANYLAYKRGNYVNVNDIGSTVVTGDVQAGVYRNAQQNGTDWVRTSTGTAQGLTVAATGLVYTEAASGGAGTTISWASSTVWHSGNAPRVIHARVTGSSGALVTGSGISVTRAGVGIYYVTYSTAFSTVPTATVTPRMSGAGTPSVGSETVNGCTVYTQNASNSGYVDADFAIHVAGN